MQEVGGIKFRWSMAGGCGGWVRVVLTSVGWGWVVVELRVGVGGLTDGG